MTVLKIKIRITSFPSRQSREESSYGCPIKVFGHDELTFLGGFFPCVT